MSNGQQQMKRIVQNFYSTLVVIDTVADTHTRANIQTHVCKYVCCAGKKQKLIKQSIGVTLSLLEQ